MADFAEVKERVKFDQVLSWLNVKTKRENQHLRGVCPICKKGGDRALFITPAKGTYYCHGGCKRGDSLIDFVAKVKGITLAQAGDELARQFMGERPQTGQSTQKAAESPKEGIKPLEYLDPAHEALAPLGVSKETWEAFTGGYATRGTMRQRALIPLFDRGVRLAYMGIAVTDEMQPRFIFGQNYDPAVHIFNCDQVEPSDLFLAKDPLAALTCFDGGITNVVSFLTPTITQVQLESLSSLMDEKRVETLEIL